MIMGRANAKKLYSQNGKGYENCLDIFPHIFPQGLWK